MPFKVLSNVDLPQPEGPIIAVYFIFFYILNLNFLIYDFCLNTHLNYWSLIYSNYTLLLLTINIDKKFKIINILIKTNAVP